MDRYDEARSLLDLATENLKETTPSEETASQLQEAINSLFELGELLDSEKPPENEVESSRPLDPRNHSGVVLANGKAEVESLVLDPGTQVLIRVAAPASADSRPIPTLTIGTVRLERTTEAGIRLSSTTSDQTYWEGQHLDEEGANDFIFMMTLGDDQTGRLQPIVQLVHLPVLDSAIQGYPIQTATLDAADSEVYISCADDLSEVVVGTSLNALIS